MSTPQASTKIEPGSDLHITLIGAKWSLNLLVSEDRQTMLEFGKACWAASRKQAIADCAEHLAKVSSQAQANLIRWMT